MSNPSNAITMDSNPDEIDRQIDKVRNLDLETSKPRLTSHKPEKTVKKTENPKQVSASTLFAILTPYLRNPGTGKNEPETSSYTPCAYHMYYIVHLMDDLMRKSFYFKRQEDAWHPLISRLYFGILFYIQTLRAELIAGTITPSHKRFLIKFLRDYPPETLSIPGPLVAIFESLNPTKPSTTLYGQVTPSIPKLNGRLTAADLILYEQGNAFHLSLPYIPGILGFIRLLLVAPANAIPDFTLPTTFDNTADRTLNGHIFIANSWNETERATLLQPGLLYPLETNNDIDTSFNRYGNRLRIPTPQANSVITNLSQFCFLHDDNTWFGNILQIMNTYSSYFLGSTTLAECTATTTVAPLIISKFTTGSTPQPNDNPIHTLTHAFPMSGVFNYDYQHETTEINIPPTAAMIAAGTKTNCQTLLRNLGFYSELGHPITTRHGPYWYHYPLHRLSQRETTWKTLGSIISEKYLLMRPKQPRD